MTLESTVRELSALTAPDTYGGPFRLACTLQGPATDDELATAGLPSGAAGELITLWRLCRSARLFEDVDYGQWGMRLLTPHESVARTAERRRAHPLDYGPDDLVFAEFLGDLDLMVISPEGHGAQVLAVPELCARDEWFQVGNSLEGFLGRYLRERGEKFWEEEPTVETQP
ncbi:hypothetical protein [Actinotalea sp. JY-7876]|uniref:hypothetical protein n=1 Tax=Actinotalea sp. JY-7876 TaxID=2758442 RepID=UPI0015F3E88E|nr:hypothetical protein [Actinotalea sp. JY-7876]